MTTLTQYDWWGGSNAPPSHLKTKNQLSEFGLKPVQAVGYIRTKKYVCKLYDPTDPKSAVSKKVCSPKQLAALAKAREKSKQKAKWRHWENWVSQIEADRAYAVRWARHVLAHPDDYVILDTETTGLYDAQVVEIAIIDLGGNELLNSLVRPSCSIPSEATAIHGISDKTVAYSPIFPEIYPEIVEIVNEKKVLVYNFDFDYHILKYCCKLYGLRPVLLKKMGDCIMEWYAQWVGDWSDYWGDYTWQPLNGGHRACSDCVAALRIIEQMAEDSPEIFYPEGYPEHLKLHIDVDLR